MANPNALELLAMLFYCPTKHSEVVSSHFL